MTDTGTRNFEWARALVAALVGAGIRHAVISPGSRSTPAALAVLRHPRVTVHVAVDERSAAFFALGIARVTGVPPLLLATSGTAVANWLPAVVEASLAAVPLLLLSADRPAELHGFGANQTIPQAGLFTPFVRASHALEAPARPVDVAYLRSLSGQVVEQAQWPHPGPVHLNLPFREPLLPAIDVPVAALPPATTVGRPALQPSPAALADAASRLGQGRGAIVCGEMKAIAGFAEAVVALANRLDCPVFAEPLSGLRFGTHDRSCLVVRYNRWPVGASPRPDWVLRFGNWPVTRRLQEFAGAAGEQVLVDPLPRWSDPAHSLTCLLRADPVAACAALAASDIPPSPRGWREDCLRLDREAAAEATAEAHWWPSLLAALPAGQAVFVGNSLPVRELDSFSGSFATPLRLFANRGASGIDGNVSTALGIAAATGSVLAVIGDLTCQHDLGGLALARGLDAVIVAVNNSGGGIFDHLPQASLPEFERGWRTPQDLDFAGAAATFGLDFTRCEDGSALAAAVSRALAAGGAHLIELVASD